jgi:hypothetical protein
VTAHSRVAFHRAGYTTFGEIDLCGTGGGSYLEVEIAFQIEPGYSGSRDEPPYGPEAYDIEVIRYKTPKGEWKTPSADLEAVLTECVDPSWLVEQAE